MIMRFAVIVCEWLGMALCFWLLWQQQWALACTVGVLGAWLIGERRDREQQP